MVTNESMGNVVTALRGRPVKAVDGSGLVFPGSAAAFLAEVVDRVEDEEAEDREEEDEIEETEEVAVPVVVVAAAAAAVETVWVKVTVIPRSLVVVRTVRIRPAGRVVVAGS